ncbi:amidohydrolase [Podospora didyma]|uniref:Amidohydrolase n=1 Tax=Podospora didyma TaxID=330526 RepID=A0AAE0K1H1_9PEZI|nr:amidohydrolase [Podospora didyma]
MEHEPAVSAYKNHRSPCLPKMIFTRHTLLPGLQPQLLKMHLNLLSWLVLALPSLATTVSPKVSSILFSGGTIIAFNYTTEGLEVIRNGSVLVTGDRITGIFSSSDAIPPLATGTEQVDITGKIITTGFIDTHRHGWQTVYKTLIPNISLSKYFIFFGRAATLMTPEDVHISQLAGLYEALNAGVTSILDHAHHIWGSEYADAGLQATIESGARVFWAFALNSNIQASNFTITEQLEKFRDIGRKAAFKNTPTTLGLGYDGWGPLPNVTEVEEVVAAAKEFNVSVITTHSLEGAWGYDNSPQNVHSFGALNTSIPVVFSHASFLTATDAQLLRVTNQYVSVTPESEMHYGHDHPKNHLILDQASIGVDTHITFSSDILTQTRLWLQATRRELYRHVLDDWHVPSTSPMSVNQAFLLATRHGGLALRRSDIGVLAVGAKADLVVWDGTSPSLLGWNDPVAAVILHASVGDIEHVLVDGKWKKRDGKVAEKTYPEIRRKFLESAARIQKAFLQTPLPDPSGTFFSGYDYAEPLKIDTLRGPGTGYGHEFWE